MNIWTYVITVDCGSAPNYEPPATTLAICKPRIRKYAKEGEVVLAFNSVKFLPREPHSVRWAGVVSEVIPLADYWNDPRFEPKKPGFSKRPDNIYKRARGGELKQVKNHIHQPQDAERDKGGKNVLVFRKRWYFGNTVAVLPAHFGLRITGIRQGQRKMKLSEVDWRALQRWLNIHTPKHVKLPHLSGKCGSCGSIEDTNTPSRKTGCPSC